MSEEQPETGIGGCWMAYHADGSAFVPFADELSALRYAIDFSMTVRFVEWGDPDWQIRRTS